MGEERPWEKCYPPGVRWDAPIERAPLPVLSDAFTATYGPGPHPKMLRTFLGDKLGRHALPAHLEFRDALPKTVGKLSRKELIEEERQKQKTQLRPN